MDRLSIPEEDWLCQDCAGSDAIYGIKGRVLVVAPEPNPEYFEPLNIESEDDSDPIKDDEYVETSDSADDLFDCDDDADDDDFTAKKSNKTSKNKRSTAKKSNKTSKNKRRKVAPKEETNGP